MKKSSSSKKIGEIPVVIDKFHFKNHIGDWCIKNCDPYKHLELKQVNTPVCEQLFKRINKHTNCKGMSESNYFLFWLTNLDHHNLDIEGLAGIVADPRSEHRWNSITIHPVNFDKLPSKLKSDPKPTSTGMCGSEKQTPQNVTSKPTGTSDSEMQALQNVTSKLS